MGPILSLIAAILATSKDLVSKGLSLNVDSTTSTFGSFFFALPYYLILLLVLWITGHEHSQVTKYFLLLVLLRGTSDACAEWIKMSAIGMGEISYVMPFLSLAPLFLLFLSPIITGDPISAAGGFGVVLALLGSLVIVYKPSSAKDKHSFKAIFFGLAASFFFALNNCFDRLAVQVASPALSGAAMTLFNTVLFLPLVIRHPARLGLISKNKNQFLLRGAFEVGFMVTKLSALQYLSAPYVAAIMKVSILSSIIGGKLLYKDHDFLRRILAGILILAGVVVIVLA